MGVEIVPTELIQEALSWPQRATAFVVSSPETFEAGAGVLAGIKGLRAKVAETFDPIIKKAHEAHKAALAAKSEHDKPLDEAERIVKGKLAAYQADQERIRQEAQRALEAELRRQEKERRLAEAVALEAEGDTQAAEEILSKPVTVPLVKVESTTPKVAGLSFTTTYGAEVTDLAALVRFVAQRPDMLNLLTPNGPALNALARAQRDAFSVPGCKLVKSTSTRSGR